MRLLSVMLCLPFLLVFDAKAQNEWRGFIINVGYLHSLTKITESPGNLVGIAEYHGKPGFYAGMGYEALILRSILSRTEVAYQNKGHRFDGLQNGSMAKITTDIHYLSIRQLVGLIHVKDLNLFVGPEINLLVSSYKQNPKMENFEAGISGCLSYRFGRATVNLDYFRGFNRYARLGNYIQYFDLYNSNFRLGIGYSLNKVRYNPRFGSFKNNTE